MSGNGTQLAQRNLDKRNGLVNGTRLQVRRVSRRLLHCVILTAGPYQGNDAYIPRIRMKPKSRTFPFTWTRLQFPVKLSYAMTYVSGNIRGVWYTADLSFLLCGRINKSQGQTLTHIAVLLAQPVLSANGGFVRSEPLPCFAHGQLVVALSRVGHPDRVSVYLHRSQFIDRRTESIVLPGALLGDDTANDVRVL